MHELHHIRREHRSGYGSADPFVQTHGPWRKLGEGEEFSGVQDSEVEVVSGRP
eukprot:SAG31_NODE_1214_length_9340_cov_30.386799_3_plen_53_part_00